jgi:hypothetical protein
VAFRCESLPAVAANTNLTYLAIERKKWSFPNADAIATLKKLQDLHIEVPELGYPLQFQFLARIGQFRNFSLTTYDYFVPTRDLNEILYQCLPPNLLGLQLAYPGPDFGHLTHLTNLDSLRMLRHTTNNQYLSQLSNLTHLSILEWSDEQDFKEIGKLIRSRELHLQSSSEGIDEDNMPDLSELVNIITLDWSLPTLPLSRFAHFKCMTKLEDLAIHSNNLEISIENCDILAELTNLTRLRLTVDTNVDSLWRNLTCLTNLAILVLTRSMMISCYYCLHLAI